MSGLDRPAGSGAPESSEDAAAVGDAQLLARSRNGDMGAFTQLVRRHQDAIFGLVHRMVRDHAISEELTQDTFFKAYRGLASFRGDSRFSTWLYRIAVNLCHDYRGSVVARLRRDETGIGPESTVRELTARGARPDESAITRELAADFQRCLDALEGHHRTAFILRHQEGLGYDEIAVVLDISRSNAKVRVHRARESILQTMRTMGHDV